MTHHHDRQVCRCGAVVMQCRCMGPKADRVVCESCPTCQRVTIAALAKNTPKTGTPVAEQSDPGTAGPTAADGLQRATVGVDPEGPSAAPVVDDEAAEDAALATLDADAGEAPAVPASPALGSWEALPLDTRTLTLVYLRDYQLKSLEDGMGGIGDVPDELIAGTRAACATLERIAKELATPEEWARINGGKAGQG